MASAFSFVEFHSAFFSFPDCTTAIALVVLCGWWLQRRQAAAHKSRLYFPLEESQYLRSRLGIGAAACQ